MESGRIQVFLEPNDDSGTSIPVRGPCSSTKEASHTGVCLPNISTLRATRTVRRDKSGILTIIRIPATRHDAFHKVLSQRLLTNLICRATSLYIIKVPTLTPHFMALRYRSKHILTSRPIHQRIFPSITSPILTKEVIISHELLRRVNIPIHDNRR